MKIQRIELRSDWLEASGRTSVGIKTHHFHPRFSSIPLRTKHRGVMDSEKVHGAESSQIGGFNMSPDSLQTTIISCDFLLNQGQPSETPALPITNAAVQRLKM